MGLVLAVLSLGRDAGLDLLAPESDGFGLDHPLQDCDVVEFVDRVLETKPFDRPAGVDVDDEEAATRLRVLGLEDVGEREAFERLVVAGAGKAESGPDDDAFVTDEASVITGNVLDNDHYPNSTLTVTGVNGGALLAPAASTAPATRW